MAVLDFQLARTLNWLRQVFGGKNLDVCERAIRFGEEVLELMQVERVTREQAHALVDQVYDKPVGDRSQEIGGVLVTLGSYFAVTGIHFPEILHERELTRCEDPHIMAKIRRKHDQKLVVSSVTA